MEVIDQSNKYKDINVLVIEDNSDVQKLMTLHLKHFDCNVFLRGFSDKFSLEELQRYQMILISVLPDKAGIRLLMKIQKKMIECGVHRKAKFVAYTACGKAMVGKCMNCGFDDVLEAPVKLKDYKVLLERFYPNLSIFLERHVDGNGSDITKRHIKH